MSDRTFTFVWDDAKRLTVLHSLGFMYAKLEKSPTAVTETVLGLIGELSRVPGADKSGTEVARAVLAPPTPVHAPPTQPMDYFQRDKKGNVLMSAPEDSDLSCVRIVSTTKVAKTGRTPYLQVIFAAGTSQNGSTRPAGKASCFDSELWNPIKNREGQVMALWIQESGNYLNIVGVRV